MSKKLVQDFYKSDALINSEIMDTFLHPDIVLDWHSSTGFKQLKRQDLLTLTTELSKEGNAIAVRYSHYIKTIENPREEMLLAHFMVIWELKDDKLYRGYQISQLPK